MLDEGNRKRFIEVFPQFAQRLSAQGLSRLLESCTPVTFKSGRNLLRDKMPTDSVFFVLSGEATLFLEDGEHQSVSLGTIHAGHLLGEVSILSRQMTASSTVQATRDIKALKLHHQPLEELLNDSETGPALLELISDILASRLKVAA